jgi:uncharacterized protein (DUF952 family)/mannose-6-phosphate isomerase-like protein (cupin superfamily)
MTKFSVMETAPFVFNGLNIRDITSNVNSLSSFAHIEISPFSTHRLSYSKKSEKYYYVLSGQLHFYLDGSEFVLSKNEFCIVPPQSKFSYANRSNETVEILLIHTPKFNIENEVFEEEYFKKLNIFHIIDEPTYTTNAKDGYYVNPGLQKEGFIHFCDFNLLNAVANHYYKNQSELIVLDVNPTLLESKLLFENSINDRIYYPHVYGPLNLNAITRVIKIKRIDGSFNPEKECRE